jgi:uncharacterized protein YqhQ
MAKKATHSKPRKDVGGQAVIEGVMMKSKSKIAVAVRKPNGKISVKVSRHKPITKKYKILSVPVVRGFVELVDMMVAGLKALTYSANESSEDEEQLGKGEIAITFLIATLFTIGLFVALPLVIAKYATAGTGILFDLVDGILRLAIFLVYIYAISKFKDMRKVFQYHGAEHCTVHCYEHGKKLTPENAIKFTTLHPRCGTSFLVIVIAISIVIFSFITDPRWIVKFLSRIILIPVIAGIGYELLKLSSKFGESAVMKVLVQPGLWVQKITTARPTKKQLEVAIAALNKVI